MMGNTEFLAQCISHAENLKTAFQQAELEINIKLEQYNTQQIKIKNLKDEIEKENVKIAAKQQEAEQKKINTAVSKFKQDRINKAIADFFKLDLESKTFQKDAKAAAQQYVSTFLFKTQATEKNIELSHAYAKSVLEQYLKEKKLDPENVSTAFSLLISQLSILDKDKESKIKESSTPPLTSLTDGCDLYLMSEFNTQESEKIKGNAVILTNKNTAYFIIEDKIVMKDAKVQTVEKIDRQDIALSDSTKPKKYTVSPHKKEEIIKQATLKRGYTLPDSKNYDDSKKILNEAIASLTASLDSEHINKILFFICKMLNLKPEDGKEFGMTETRAHAKKIADTIKSDYTSGKLDRLISEDDNMSSIAPQDLAQSYLKQYVEKSSFREKEIVFKAIESLLNVKADNFWERLAATLDTTEKRKKIYGTTLKLLETKATLWWYDALDKQEINEIEEITSVVSESFGEYSMSTTVHYEGIVPAILDILKKDRPGKFVDFLNKYIDSETQLLALKDKFAIAQYFKETLILYLNQRTLHSPSKSQYESSLIEWLNVKLPSPTEKQVTVKLSEHRAKKFVLFKKTLLDAGATKDNQSRILGLLNILANHQENPPMMAKEIREEMTKGDKGLFGKAVFAGLLKAELDKNSLTLHSEHDTIPDSLPPNAKAILRHVKGVGNDADLRIFDPCAAASIDKQNGIPIDSKALDQKGLETAREELEKTIQLEPTPKIDDSIERTRIVSFEQQKKQAEQAAQTALSEMQTSQKQLQEAQNKLLTLLRKQVLLATLRYAGADKNRLLHNDNGLSAAHTLLMEIYAPNNTFGQAIDKLILFLKKRNNLRDQSFTTGLLSQLLAENGGLLSSAVPTSASSSAATKIVEHADAVTEKFAHQNLVLETVLSTRHEKKEISQLNLNELKALGTHFKSLSEGSPQPILPKVMRNDSLLNSLDGGRSSVTLFFGLFGSKNNRVEAEAAAIQGLEALPSFNN